MMENGWINVKIGKYQFTVGKCEGLGLVITWGPPFGIEGLKRHRKLGGIEILPAYKYLVFYWKITLTVVLFYFIFSFILISTLAINCVSWVQPVIHA